MYCNRCQGTGFLNLHQINDAVLDRFNDTFQHGLILEWIALNEDHDVQICDCCGDGEDWYGEPGYHYTHPDEPFAECV